MKQITLSDDELKYVENDKQYEVKISKRGYGKRYQIKRMIVNKIKKFARRVFEN